MPSRLPTSRSAAQALHRTEGMFSLQEFLQCCSVSVPELERAQLVRLPEGAALLMRMPYDESFEVRGVFRGYLSGEGLLPQSGNAIGDTWVVGNTPWDARTSRPD